jgi:membrane-associated phospholipid phosphatase
MDSLIQFGIEFVVWFQGLGGWLAGPMKFFSFLGSEDFFLFVLPLAYWCIDAGLGIRIGLILLASNGVNDLFKMAMHGPRPYWASASVTGMASETSFGVPSGHAQNAAGVWGVIAARYQRNWVWVAAIGVILFIGLSRLYLGVHFPHDVLVGWALGFVILWAFVKFWDPAAARLKKMTLAAQALTAFLVSVTMILLAALVVFLSRDFVVPADWIANAMREGGEEPNPLTLSGIFSSMGTLFGLGSGVAWINARGGFSAAGPTLKRVLRYVVGFAGVAILYYGLKMVFPSGEDLVALAFRYIRYAFVGVWMAAGAPWLFTKMKLAGNANS